MYKCFALLFGLLLLATPALSKHKKLKSGCWHTELQLTPSVSLPFKIIIEKEKQLSHIHIVNAEENIELHEVSSRGDSIFISFSTFASEIRAKVISGNHIRGAWHNHARKGNYQIPFESKHGDGPRFHEDTSSIDVAGRWEVTFNYNEDNPYKSVGLFDDFLKRRCDTDRKLIKGTFLTETGDYRFLEGDIRGDSLVLSTFDGSHAFLFQARFKDDTLWGDFYSGSHYHAKWFGVKNSSFELKHPDSLTYVINDSPVSFSLPGLDDTQYTYPNEKTKGKVTLIQIMGTWCPNCLDESKYLKELGKKYEGKIEIIAVAYETQKSIEEKIEKVKKYKEFLGLDYTIIIGGNACKSCASEQFSMVNKIISFPTLIFIDKEGEVRKIHTGFNGPGTGNYYTEFVKNTDAFVKSLVEE